MNEKQIEVECSELNEQPVLRFFGIGIKELMEKYCKVEINDNTVFVDSEGKSLNATNFRNMDWIEVTFIKEGDRMVARKIKMKDAREKQ